MLLLAFTVAAIGSCGLLLRERVCDRGEYAARSIEYPDTGGVCVPNGKEPPARL